MTSKLKNKTKNHFTPSFYNYFILLKMLLHYYSLYFYSLSLLLLDRLKIPMQVSIYSEKYT